ncbi:Wadjet anti-phage system protein JetA family protein [Bradyrhizobium sp. CCBAU 11357]|uniref:Wadjet anti-phage system protein JetA family protein n=1 Tax=Bradyrhizobium sp. CCBAU 11357 TaxID=1630808 RepID=UPI0023026F0F|nr:Wadjet anti-phage system protein JetA family protein [Bradyrhizobium sp. CCBAU 11357]
MESKTVATRLEAFFEEFVEQLLLKDFESILTVNHPYRFRDAIADLARRISYTPETIQVLAEEYTASSMAADNRGRSDGRCRRPAGHRKHLRSDRGDVRKDRGLPQADRRPGPQHH